MAKTKRLDPLKISLIGFGALFVFFIAMIIINRPASWEEYIVSQSEEETFFVYVYSDYCSICRDIADDVADFTVSNPMDIELIPVDANNPSVPVPRDETVPRIYVVHNGEITDVYIGSTSPTQTGVLDLFNKVENQTFQP